MLACLSKTYVSEYSKSTVWNFKFYILVFIHILFPVSQFAQATPEDPIVLVDSQGNYPITTSISVYEDTNKEYKIEDILNGNVSFSTTKETSFGMTQSAIWVRISVTNSSSYPGQWYLELGYPGLDQIRFYYPKEGKYESFQAGDFFHFDERMIPYRNYLFPLSFQKAGEGSLEPTVFYLRVESKDGVSIPLKIFNEATFNEHRASEQFVFGIYFGLIAVMAIYNLFIFLAVRDMSYLYYVLYIVSFGLFQLHLNGLAFQYLWPDSSWTSNHAGIFLVPLFTLFIAQFSRSFLITKQYLPRFDSVLKINQMIGICLAILVLVLDVSEILWTIVAIFGLSSIIQAVVSAVLILKKGYKPAIYYLLAWFAPLTGGTLFALNFLGILPNHFIIVFGLQIGVALEVILFSFALASRINLIKKEKEEAQAKTLEMQKILTESYARFVPRDFLANLGKESILDVRLGDQIQKDMAVLFSDIRSFTTLSEKMSPAENFNFINSYLGRMSPIIQKHNGFIDKFIGDAIMALFDKQVLDAVAAGVEMQLYLKEYNAFRARRTYDPIQIGIGIHSGSLMLGTIGAEERLEGTVISDTVNLASRIENLTKVYGARIAVSESAIAEIKDNQFSFRFLDRVKVKGKQKPVSIYEIIDGDEESDRELKNQTKSDYESGVKSFHIREFLESKSFFDKVIKANPNDKSTQLYLKRLYAVANPVAIVGNDPEAFLHAEDHQ